MKKILSTLISTLILSMVLSSSALAAMGETILVSRSSTGIIGNGASQHPSISDYGRFVAFDSLASNLSPNDKNVDKSDVFVKDLSSGEIHLISYNSSSAKAGNHHSAYPSISADGRLIAFESLATNLDPTCNNGFSHIYVYDLETQAVACASVYLSHAGTTIQANGNSYRPAISADGRYIAFSSEATKLVEGDSNSVQDIFVHDRESGETTLVSRGWDGSPAQEFSYGAAISGNGRYIAFTSMANNLIEGYSNLSLDVFLFDQQTESTRLVSVNNSSEPGNGNSEYPSLSYSGLLIVFESRADNLVSNDTNDKKDIFLRNLTTGITRKISIAPDGTDANDDSFKAVISANGKFVSYESFANNLITEYISPIRDIFLFEIQTGITSLVSMASDGTRSSHDCFSPSISKDGRYVAFSSEVFYFAVGDENSASDIFRHENFTVENNLYIFLPVIMR